MDTIRILEDMESQQAGIMEKAALADAILAVRKQIQPDCPRTTCCPECGQPCTLFDTYCRHCGQRLPLWTGWDGMYETKRIRISVTASPYKIAD